MPDNLVGCPADSGQQERHDERAGDGKVEELLQEIGGETGQPARPPVDFREVISIVQEQVQLLAADEMVWIGRLEETERPQEGQPCDPRSDKRFDSLFHHLTKMRFFSRFSKDKGGGRSGPPPPL